MLELLKDLAGYVHSRRKYWLTPILVVMLVVGSIVVVTETSSMGTFLYTLF